MRRRWLWLLGPLAVFILGNALVAHAVGDRLFGGSTMVRQLGATVTSFHVDVSNDLSQGPPSLSADVALRPERAYSWVYPSTGAKHIQIGTRFSVTTYRQVGSAGRWLAYTGYFAHPGYFEQRLLVADPWTWMEPAGLVSRDQLPDGPAWHLHGPQLHCCYSIDLWVGLDGLPRRAVEVFPGGNADGIERPPYPMRFTYSKVNRVAPISAPEPNLVVKPDMTVTGTCARWSDHSRLRTTNLGHCAQNYGARGAPPYVLIGGADLEVHRVGMAAEPPLPPPSPGGQFVLDLRLANQTSTDLPFRLTVDNGIAELHLAPRGEMGMVAAGTLGPHQNLEGRLVYQLPGTRASSDFATTSPWLLDAVVGGHDVYVLLEWYVQPYG